MLSSPSPPWGDNAPVENQWLKRTSSRKTYHTIFASFSYRQMAPKGLLSPILMLIPGGRRDWSKRLLSLAQTRSTRSFCEHPRQMAKVRGFGCHSDAGFDNLGTTNWYDLFVLCSFSTWGLSLQATSTFSDIRFRIKTAPRHERRKQFSRDVDF